MQLNLRKCYQILELEPGATLEDVKISYRTLVKVWHPDRFSDDSKLQREAQERLKLLNLAYEMICEASASESGTSSSTQSQTPNQEPPHYRNSSTQNETQGEEQTRQPVASNPSGWKQFLKIFATAIFASVTLVFVSSRLNREWHENTHIQSQQPAQTISRVDSNNANIPEYLPREKLSIEVIQSLYQGAKKENPDFAMTLQEFSRFAQTKMPGFDFSEGINYPIKIEENWGRIAEEEFQAQQEKMDNRLRPTR